MKPSSVLWVTGLGLALALACVLVLVRRVEHASVHAESRAASAPAPKPTTEDVVPGATPDASAGVAAEPAGEGERPEERAPIPRGAGQDVAFEMRVQVQDASDFQPVAGASVTFFDRASPAPVRTDEHGIALVPLARPRERARLHVEGARHASWSRELDSAPTCRVELHPAASVSGRVLAADTGEPVPGATLELHYRDGSDGLRAVAGADGAFEFARVALRASAELEIRAPGFADSRRVFELRGGAARVRQDVHLVRGLELEGRVEDWVSGGAIAGARVDALEVAADGHFQGLVPASPVTGATGLDVTAPGHATLHVQLALPQRGGLVFRLPALAGIEGRVTDPSGAPLADARVSFRADGSEHDGPAHDENGAPLETTPLYDLPAGWSYTFDGPEGTSGADGRYRVLVPPWTVGGKIVVSRAAFRPLTSDLPAIGEPGSVLARDVQLAPADARVLLRGAVMLDGLTSDGLEGTVTWRGPTRSGSAVVRRGGFQAEVEPGDVRVQAVLDLFPDAPSREVAARLEPGESADLELDVTTRAALEATITGSVLFDGGVPVPGVEVVASCTLPPENEPNFFVHAFTDANGEYVLPVVDLRLTYTVAVTPLVRAGSPRETLVYQSIRAGTSDLDFKLLPRHHVFLRAREARTGTALAHERDVLFFARVRTGQRAGLYRLFPVLDVPDADGWYEFWIEDSGVELLALPRAAQLPSYGAGLLRRVEFPAREPARLEFALAPGRELAVSLADDVEPWPSDHWLFLVEDGLAGQIDLERTSLSREDLTARWAAFDGSGRATLRGLSSGTYRFEVIPGGLSVEPAVVEVGANTDFVAVRWSRTR